MRSHPPSTSSLPGELADRCQRFGGFRSGGALCLLLGLLLGGLLAGCGYSLVGRASNLPPDIEQIYVRSLDNQTNRLQVEQILTQSIIEEMVTRRRYEVVNQERNADAVLRGTVTGFEVRPVGFDSEGLANNFQIVITADMRFERPPKDGGTEPEVIWKNSRYVFRDDYPLEEGQIDYFDRENLAIEDTAEEFAKTLVTDILEGF